MVGNLAERWPVAGMERSAAFRQRAEEIGWLEERIAAGLIEDPVEVGRVTQRLEWLKELQAAG
jgi:hypothetical protein